MPSAMFEGTDLTDHDVLNLGKIPSKDKQPSQEPWLCDKQSISYNKNHSYQAINYNPHTSHLTPLTSHLIPIPLLRNFFQRLSPRVGSTNHADDEGDEEEGNHAVGSEGEAFAVLAVDVGEDESPDG